MYKENILMIIEPINIDEIEEKININARSKIFYPEDNYDCLLILLYINEMNNEEKKYLKEELKLKDKDFSKYKTILLYL